MDSLTEVNCLLFSLYTTMLISCNSLSLNYFEGWTVLKPNFYLRSTQRSPRSLTAALQCLRYKSRRRSWLTKNEDDLYLSNWQTIQLHSSQFRLKQAKRIVANSSTPVYQQLKILLLFWRVKLLTLNTTTTNIIIVD